MERNEMNSEPGSGGEIHLKDVSVEQMREAITARQFHRSRFGVRLFHDPAFGKMFELIDEIERLRDDNEKVRHALRSALTILDPHGKTLI